MSDIEIKLQLAQESIKLQRHSDLKRKYLLFIFTFKHASTFTAHCPLVNAHTDGLPAYLKTCTNRHKCCESPKYGHKILSRRAGGRAGGQAAVRLVRFRRTPPVRRYRTVTSLAVKELKTKNWLQKSRIGVLVGDQMTGEKLWSGIQSPVCTAFSRCKTRALDIRDRRCSSWFGLDVKQWALGLT